MSVDNRYTGVGYEPPFETPSDKDFMAAHIESLNERIEVLEDENTKLRNEIIFVYRRLNCNDETAKSIVLGSIEIRFPEIYRAALEVKP